MSIQDVYRFIGVNENLLSAHDRKNLPGDNFGLPNERKYPLNDEAHIRKAIQFFKYCPGEQKKILATNINKRAKILNMQLNISPSNPFYKYVDKNIITESFCSIDCFTLEGLLDIPNVEHLSAEIRDGLSYIENKYILTEGQMLDFEKELQAKHIPRLITLFKKDIESGKHLLNPLRVINVIMQNQYMAFFNFDYFIMDNKIQNTNETFYTIISDICYTIYDKITSANKNIKYLIANLDELVSHFSCNVFFIERKIQEVLFSCYIHRQELIHSKVNDTNIAESIVNNIETPLNIFLNTLRNQESTLLSIMNIPKKVMSSIITTPNMNLHNTENYLNTLKNELKNQIHIIIMANRLSIIPDYFNDDKTFLLKDVHRDNLDMFNIIESMSGEVISSNIKCYNREYSILLDDKDILTFTRLKKIVDIIYMGKDKLGDNIFFGIKNNILYLLGKTNVSGEVLLIKLYDSGDLNVSDNFTTTNYKKLTALSISKINVSLDTNMSMILADNILTEGIAIDKEGNIKYELKPKKTYMDEYADNHRLLLINLKSKNYDGAKKNLAFLFAMISSIERDVLYNTASKLSAEQRKDAEKARTFAINDFKTYLKEVQKAEPKFDFTKFYEDGSYDNFILNISHDSILGVKRLFKTIMLP